MTEKRSRVLPESRRTSLRYSQHPESGRSWGSESSLRREKKADTTGHIRPHRVGEARSPCAPRPTAMSATPPSNGHVLTAVHSPRPSSAAPSPNGANGPRSLPRSTPAAASRGRASAYFSDARNSSRSAAGVALRSSPERPALAASSPARPNRTPSRSDRAVRARCLPSDRACWSSGRWATGGPRVSAYR